MILPLHRLYLQELVHLGFQVFTVQEYYQANKHTSPLSLLRHE